jgi:hypothetical protein
MPTQEEHDKPENLVESPHEAEHAARSLEDEVDSNATLQGYYAMNNARPSEDLEKEAAEDRKKAAEEGRPVP